jgi:hypothetical protein
MLRSAPAEAERLVAGDHTSVNSVDCFRSNLLTTGAPPLILVIASSKTLWSKLKCLLEPATQTIPCPPADDFLRHFAAKVSSIRQSTADAPAPTVSDRATEPLTTFRPVTSEELSSCWHVRRASSVRWTLHQPGSSSALVTSLHQSLPQCAMRRSPKLISRRITNLPSLGHCLRSRRWTQATHARIDQSRTSASSLR